MPTLQIKLYMYQLLRSLAYIHSVGICHRDIKPQNLLLNPSTGALKLCDFGSAKILVAGEPNVSYICSRYYRAPELIFGATNYSTNIDIWSTGCVMAELMLGQPLFPGDSGIDQLVEIIKVLGTPTREQIKTMNPNYMEHKFPQIKPHPFSKVCSCHVLTPPVWVPETSCERIHFLFCFQVFRPRTPVEAIDLVSRLLEYTPSARLSAIEAMCHSFFDDLRVEATKMPNGKDLPPLFDFTREGKLDGFSCGSCSLIIRSCRAVDPPRSQFPTCSVLVRTRAGLAWHRYTQLYAHTARGVEDYARLECPSQAYLPFWTLGLFSSLFLSLFLARLSDMLPVVPDPR